jgi:hypothetical protein
MSVDLQGSLRFWVFLIVLVALFSAALFRPERIRRRARLWIAAGLLAFILFLECIAPLFFSPSLAGSPSSGGATRVDSLSSGVQDYLTAVKVIAVLQHGALAVAVLVALSAFFDAPLASGERPARRVEAVSRQRTEGARQPTPRPRPVEDACLSCGQRIPPDAGKCPACGWTWGTGEAASG